LSAGVSGGVYICYRERR